MITPPTQPMLGTDTASTQTSSLTHKQALKMAETLKLLCCMTKWAEMKMQF